MMRYSIIFAGLMPFAAFQNVKSALVDDAKQFGHVQTVPVTVDENTTPDVVTGLVPARNADGTTPEALEGVFWMRGNPLPDYLLSFANFHWTTVGGSNYGFLATFAPGSFAWKEKTNTTDVPEICRVPHDDAVLEHLARLAASHDSRKFDQPIAEDLKEAEADVSDADAQAFVDGVWNGGQLDLDGGDSVKDLAAKHFFYAAKFGQDYTTASVTIFKLLTGPVPLPLEVPESVASFSLAPHGQDPDVYLRKSFIRGKSKVPNYYWLTRIVDGQGQPTPHYREFLECVKERSAGRILKVERAP